MNILDLSPAHTEELIAFFGTLTDEDLTFIREDLSDVAATRNLPHAAGMRWVAVDEATITGYAAVLRLPGWSDHVGELRLVVHPAHRRSGVGRALAQHVLTAALAGGMRKIVVELAAEQEYASAMFADLGFTGEALLRDHIRDRSGQLRDLVVLAHIVDEEWSALDAVGLADTLLA
jgi:ribosomal protein S18 acetylase RimI-like enzyme